MVQCSRPNNAMRLNAIPPIPVADAATSILDTSFTANWESVVGADVTYRIDVATDSGFIGIVDSNVIVNGTSTSIGGLAGNTTYYYRIRSANLIGSSGNSNTISLTTLSSAPVITSVGISATGGDLCSTGQWVITYSWTTTGADDTDYQIDVDTATDAGGVSFSGFSTGNTTASSNSIENSGTQGNVNSAVLNHTFYRVGRIKVIRKSDSAEMSHSDTSQVTLSYGDDPCS